MILSDSWAFGNPPYEIVVLAGVHGNEKAGVLALKEFIKSEEIKKINKSVIFILGNPKAYEKNVRYTESDLNREFGIFDNSYEGQRAKEIAEFLKDAKVMLDLHLTQTPTEKPFAVFPFHKPSIDFLQKMDVCIEDVVLAGGYNSTDEYLIKCNKSAVALGFETGSILDSPEKAIELGKKLILETLKLAGALEDDNKNRKSKKVYFWKEKQAIPNKENIKLVPGLANMIDVKKGQIIAYEGKNPILSEFDGKTLFPKYAKTKDAYLVRIISKEDI
jgi:succinylglutamate desuccinylase